MRRHGQQSTWRPTQIGETVTWPLGKEDQSTIMSWWMANWLKITVSKDILYINKCNLILEFWSTLDLLQLSSLTPWVIFTRPWLYTQVALHWSLTQFTPAAMDVQPQNPLERTYPHAMGGMVLGFSWDSVEIEDLDNECTSWYKNNMWICIVNVGMHILKFLLRFCGYHKFGGQKITIQEIPPWTHAGYA